MINSTAARSLVLVGGGNVLIGTNNLSEVVINNRISILTGSHGLIKTFPAKRSNVFH